MDKMRLNSHTWDLIVVGGGPAGFFAALACAAGAPVGSPFKILILEKANRPLGKVLVSGGGRCNLTHACYDPAQLVEYYPRGGPALRGAFTRFQPSDTVAWFKRRGVSLKTEPDGRIFPASNDAQTVVECLLDAADQAGIRLRTRSVVDAIFAHAEGGAARFTVALNASTETFKARCLLLATGGDAASGTAGTPELAESLGHSLKPAVPSLFTFRIPDPRLEGLAGISVDPAGLQLLNEDGTPLRAPGMQQLGPLLITHWGLSGPAVLRLSAWAARELNACAYQAGLRINWLGEMKQEQALADLLTFKEAHAGQKQPGHQKRHAARRRHERDAERQHGAAGQHHAALADRVGQHAGEQHARQGPRRVDGHQDADHPRVQQKPRGHPVDHRVVGARVQSQHADQRAVEPVLGGLSAFHAPSCKTTLIAPSR